jgi:predicted GIY-YIG superfamily endonuclease
MSLSERSESKTPWFVYIAQANTGRYYVGITKNPNKRLAKHNSGEGSKFARDQGPFKLVYISASFGNKSEARKREIQLKGWTRQKKEKLITGTWS